MHQKTRELNAENKKSEYNIHFCNLNTIRVENSFTTAIDRAVVVVVAAFFFCQNCAVIHFLFGNLIAQHNFLSKRVVWR